MEKKPDISTQQCLDALMLVCNFLDQEQGSVANTIWTDKAGYGFRGDMGYLFEGLDAMEEYLRCRVIREERYDRD